MANIRQSTFSTENASAMSLPTKHPLHLDRGIAIGFQPDCPRQTVSITPLAMEAGAVVMGPDLPGNARILAAAMRFRAQHNLPSVAVDPAGLVRQQLDIPPRQTDVISLYGVPYQPSHNPLAAEAAETPRQIAQTLCHTQVSWGSRLESVLTVLLADMRRQNRLCPGLQLTMADLDTFQMPEPSDPDHQPRCRNYTLETDQSRFWDLLTQWPEPMLTEVAYAIRRIGTGIRQARPIPVAAAIADGCSLLITGNSQTVPAAAARSLVAAICERIAAAIRHTDADLMLIADQPAAAHFDWASISDPALPNPASLMVSCPGAPEAGPMMAHCGTLVARPAAVPHMEQLFDGDQPTARCIRQLTRQYPQAGVVYTDAYGGPTAVPFCEPTPEVPTANAGRRH